MRKDETTSDLLPTVVLPPVSDCVCGLCVISRYQADHANLLFDILFLLGLPIWIVIIRLYDRYHRDKAIRR
jgi:hypothetical protein